MSGTITEKPASESTVNDPAKEPAIGRWLYKNLPNAVSLAGVLPLALLLVPDGLRFLVPLMIYNNFMDDLDGQLAVKLDLKSEFGAALDNVCDAVAHVIFVMVIGVMFGGVSLGFAIVAAAAIVLRITSRVAPPPRRAGGSATNELMRHLLLVLIATEFLGISAPPFLIAVFALNAWSMLAPYPLPHLVRSRAKTAVGIALVNAVLVGAWLVPAAASVIAVGFGLPYLYSVAVGGIGWLRRPAA